MRFDRPSIEKLNWSRAVLASNVIEGRQCCSSGGANGDFIGVRQIKVILEQKPTLTLAEKDLLDACLIQIDDIDYYYTYEKNYD